MVHTSSAPIIESYLDALWMEKGLSENTLSSYGRDLQLFGEWLQQHRTGELLRILDGDVRLITPSDRDGDGEVSHDSELYYQLAHDFLVPSLREWLTQEKRETIHGRAELRLAERVELWRAKHEDRQLPPGRADDR